MPNHTSLYDFCLAYLRNEVDSDGTAEDVSEATLQREAERLEILLYKTASSFADNQFDRNA